jgi:hypothetical protein
MPRQSTGSVGLSMSQDARSQYERLASRLDGKHATPM